MANIRRLIWDPWNISHIARHQVTPDEVEQVLGGEPVFSVTYADRIRAIGPTEGGGMPTIILAPEGGGVCYPVTARPASRKERRRYLELKGGEKP